MVREPTKTRDLRFHGALALFRGASCCSNPATRSNMTG